MSELIRKVAKLNYQVPPDSRLDLLTSKRQEDLAVIELDRSQVVVNYLQGVLNRLLDLKEFTGEQRDIIKATTIVLTDSPSALGATFSVGQKNFITISKHLLDLLQTEDQLAFVIFHEVGHAKFDLTRGRLGSSAPEEFHADCWAAKWLTQTGYDWMAGESFFKLVHSISPDNQEVQGFVQSLRKVHPESQNRIKAIRTYLGACELKDPHFKAQNHSPEALPDRIKALAATVQFKSYFDALKEACNYQALNTVEKTRVLIRVAYELIKTKDHSENRRNELWQELGHVCKKQVTDQERSQLAMLAHTFFDLCCGTSLRSTLPIGYLSHLVTGKDNRMPVPLGRLAKIDDAACAFLQADSIDQARPLASKFLDLYNNHFDRAVFWDSKEFTFFSKLEFSDERFTWHVLINQIDANTPQEIIKALALTPASFDRSLWRKLSIDQLEYILQVDFKPNIPNSLERPIQKSHSGAEFNNRDSIKENVARIFKSYLALRKISEAPVLDLPNTESELNAYFVRNQLVLQYPFEPVDPDFKVYAYGLSNKEIWQQHSTNVEPLLTHLSQKINYAENSTIANKWFETTVKNLLRIIPHRRETPSIPLDSPIINFIESIPSNLNAGLKIKTLFNLPLEIWHRNIQEQFDWLCNKTELKLPDNITELTKFIKEYKDILNNDYLAYVFNLVLEKERLSNNPVAPFSAEFLALLDVSFYTVVSRYSNEGIKNSAKATLLEHIFQNQSLTLDQLRIATEKLNFNKLTYLYKQFACIDLFPSLEARQVFEELLIERIKSQATLNSQAGLAYKLLKSSGSDPEAVCSFKTKKYCEQLVTNRISKLLGKDNNSERYLKQIKGVASVLERWGIHNSRRAILTELADICELQERAAYFVRDEVLGYYNKLDIQLQHIGVKGFEPLLKAVGKDPVSCIVFIDFLSQPLTSALLKQMVEDITNAKQGTRLTKLAESIEFYEFKKELNSEGVNSRQNYLNANQESVRLHFALSQIHSFYQQLALEERTLVIDQLLSPANAVMKDSGNTTKKAISLCLNRLFPASVRLPTGEVDQDHWDVLFLDGITKPITRLIGNHEPTDIWQKTGSRDLPQLADSPVIRRAIAVVHVAFSSVYSEQETKRQEMARIFIEAYLVASSELEKPLLVAAFMAAAEQSHASQSFGERLASILELLGPAYIKLGQAGHSLPDMPEDIKAPLGRLKGQASPPKRWEVFERKKAAIPAEIDAKIKRVGPTLGSASFNVSTQILFEQAGKIENAVMSILRENAAPDAERGYLKLEVCTERLAENDANFKELAPLLTKLIDRARALTIVETNTDVGAEQASYAHKQCDGLVVQVDQSEYKFTTAKWLLHFSEGRISKEIVGEHFGDLILATSISRVELKKIAKAYVLAEFRNLLSGDRFDCDRHGYQLRINGEHIGLFDHGGLALTVPTESEKQQLASILKEVIRRGTFTCINEVVQEHLEKIDTADANYILHVQRGILALSEFLEYLDADDYTQIIKTLAVNNDIDPIFRAALGIPKYIGVFNLLNNSNLSYWQST